MNLVAPVDIVSVALENMCRASHTSPCLNGNTPQVSDLGIRCASYFLSFTSIGWERSGDKKQSRLHHWGKIFCASCALQMKSIQRCLVLGHHLECISAKWGALSVLDSSGGVNMKLSFLVDPTNIPGKLAWTEIPTQNEFDLRQLMPGGKPLIKPFDPPPLVEESPSPSSTHRTHSQGPCTHNDWTWTWSSL